jgi:hypothetical protein
MQCRIMWQFEFQCSSLQYAFHCLNCTSLPLFIMGGGGGKGKPLKRDTNSNPFCWHCDIIFNTHIKIYVHNMRANENKRSDKKLTSTIWRLQFIYITHKHSVCNSQRTQCASITKTNHLMLHREIMAVYCGNHMENVRKMHSCQCETRLAVHNI